MWIIFQEETNRAIDIVMSVMFVACLIHSYLLIKRPTGYIEVRVRDEVMIIVNSFCPLLLIIIYFLVPLFV